MNRVFAAWAALGFLTGCVAQPVVRVPEPGIWSRPGRLLVSITSPGAHEYRLSEGGIVALFDAAQTKDSALQNYLADRPIECPADFPIRLGRSFGTVGWTVRNADSAALNALPPFQPASADFAVLDYRSLHASPGADRLLIVHGVRAGTMAEHRLFESAGAPRVFAIRDVQLVDLATNRLLWNKTYKNERMVTADPKTTDGLKVIGQELAVVTANNCEQIVETLAGSLH